MHRRLAGLHLDLEVVPPVLPNVGSSDELPPPPPSPCTVFPGVGNGVSLGFLGAAPTPFPSWITKSHLTCVKAGTPHPRHQGLVFSFPGPPPLATRDPPQVQMWIRLMFIGCFSFRAGWGLLAAVFMPHP